MFSFFFSRERKLFILLELVCPTNPPEKDLFSSFRTEHSEIKPFHYAALPRTLTEPVFVRCHATNKQTSKNGSITTSMGGTARYVPKDPHGSHGRQSPRVHTELHCGICHVDALFSRDKVVFFENVSEEEFRLWVVS